MKTSKNRYSFLAAGVALAVIPLAASAQTYTWTTIAGQAGVTGTNNGIGSLAKFFTPTGVTVDSAGNVYVADYGNNLIRELTPSGTNWNVTTIAGNVTAQADEDGTGASAFFVEPCVIAADSANPPNLFVTDYQWNTGNVRQMSRSGGAWNALTIQHHLSPVYSQNPYGVAVDVAGDIFLTEQTGNAVDTMSFQGANWTGSRILGGGYGNVGTTDGTNLAARFNAPQGIAVDANGNLYIADTGNHTVREASLIPNTAKWVTATLAGIAGVAGYADGLNTGAAFNGPDGIAVDQSGNLYVADANNNMIRKLTPQGTNWTVSTIGGQLNRAHGTADGVGTQSSFYHPASLAVDGQGRLFVADYLNSTIRMGVPSPTTNPPPSLQMATGGGTAFIMWPASASGYVLQTSTNLNTGPWESVSAGVVTNLVFSGPMTNGQRFYRLQQ